MADEQAFFSRAEAWAAQKSFMLINTCFFSESLARWEFSAAFFFLYIKKAQNK